ncbi:hypothetical protein K432DRAFT_406743 [Lepidopterella palustris CBS 459.81]|uniref:Uncharacterized protein n=1 Tax=Lepidopterella palustris CBS 459.81 TaxID=1314670 RepID=A0A8E2E6K2_9PEZI|nr:hypothetical protein K432DRAFT_406743 [Lepidopterella palustris CBS 459.81]
MRAIPWLVLSIALVNTVNANTEKIIFLGPSPITISNVHPGLDDLRLDTLSPVGQHTLETRLSVKFPTEAEPRGVESWYLLEGLEEGRRYEVRICWPATQPTQFWLDVHQITEVFETPLLISSLAIYSEQRQDLSLEDPDYGKQDSSTISASVLFLRVHSAADYYSSNRTLMEYPPAVDVDIILDPYLLNILPQSLGPTVIYITFLAIASWFVSGAIYTWLRDIKEERKPHND